MGTFFRQHWEVLLLGYILLINLVTFALYGIDKRRAKLHRWRISEKTLLLLPVLGGSVGGILGMRTFRHKTKHWYFRYGLPVILVLQVAAAAWLLLRGGA